MGTYDEPDDDYRGVTDLLERPPEPINWNLLDAEDAELEWHDLDAWVTWLKITFGLPPSIVPPYWHRHDELVWELSALHTHWLSCYHETASPSAPIAWMRDFADARTGCGTGSRSAAPASTATARPARRSGPARTAVELGGEIAIADRQRDFEEFVRADVLRRRRAEAVAKQSVLG